MICTECAELRADTAMPGLEQATADERIQGNDHGKPVLFTAVMPSSIWPVVWFTEGYRNLPLCTHREHVLGRQRAAKVEARVPSARQSTEKGILTWRM